MIWIKSCRIKMHNWMSNRINFKFYRTSYYKMKKNFKKHKNSNKL